MKEEKVKRLTELAFDITKELKNLEAELKKEKVEEIEWKPEYRELYYFVDLDLMAVDYSHWEEEESDNIRLNHKVVFKTEEETEEYLQYLLAKEKAMDEFKQEEWSGSNTMKYHIYYNSQDNSFEIDTNNFIQRFNVPHFRTVKDAQAFVDKYKKQIKRDMGICEN